MDRSEKIITAAALAAIAVLLVIGIANRDVNGRHASGRIADLVIKNKKKIIELSSVKYYDELVLFDTQYNPQAMKADTVAVVIARGIVNMGFDLSGIQASDIRIQNDTLFLSLDAPKVLDVIINPHDYEIFDHSKDWNDSARLGPMLKKGKMKMIDDAKKSGALEKAALSGADALSKFFKSFGMKEVCIEIREDSPDIFIRND